MNEYQKKYEDLIFYRQHIEILTDNKGTEVHHIKMKKLYPQLIKEPTNLVRLTTYEHILAHKYLKLWFANCYGLHDYRTQIAFLAYDLMLKTRNGIILTEEEAAKRREEFQIIQSDIMKNKWKDPQFKKNFSAKMAVIWNNQEFKQNWIDKMAIIQSDPIYRQNMSKSVKDYWENNDQAKQEQSKRSNELWKDPNHKKRISEASSNNWKNPKYRQSIIDSRINCIKLYNEQTLQSIYVKQNKVKNLLESGWIYGTPFYHMSSRGKTKHKIDIIFVCPWKYKDCRPTAGGVKWYSSLQELSLNYNVSIEECERRRIEAMKAKGIL